MLGILSLYVHPDHVSMIFLLLDVNNLLVYKCFLYFVYVVDLKLDRCMFSWNFGSVIRFKYYFVPFIIDLRKIQVKLDIHVLKFQNCL